VIEAHHFLAADSSKRKLSTSNTNPTEGEIWCYYHVSHTYVQSLGSIGSKLVVAKLTIVSMMTVKCWWSVLANVTKLPPPASLSTPCPCLKYVQPISVNCVVCATSIDNERTQMLHVTATSQWSLRDTSSQVTIATMQNIISAFVL